MSDTKDHMFYDPNYIKYPELANPQRQPNARRGGVKENEMGALNRYQVTVWSDENFWNLIVDDFTTLGIY